MAVTTGALVLGVVNGMLVGLLAVGLVLVYRSNRFLNVCHAQLGALSAMVLAKLVVDWDWPWLLAAAVAVALGAGTGLVVDRLAVSRLRARTRSGVSLMLLTVGVTQILLALSFVTALAPDGTRLQAEGYPLPFDAQVQVGDVILGGQHLLVLLLAPILVAALAAFLRWTVAGKRIRAAAANPDAARLCGISPDRMSNLAWAVAGGLSAVTAVLQAPSQGTFNAGTLGPQLLLLGLGAAAAGAFVSIPWALAGGLGLGLVEQITLAQTNDGGDARIAVFVAILAIVLVRGRAISTAFADAGSVTGDRPRLRVPELLHGSLVVRRQRAFLAAGSIALAVLAPLLPVLRSPSQRFELALILVYAVSSVSLTMVIGWAGQVSLGHFAVIGIGAFVTGRMAPHGWSLPMILLAAAAAGAVAMVLVGLPALRVRGLTLVVTTLGLAIVSQEWLFRRPWFGSATSSGFDIPALPILHGLGRPGSQLAAYYTALVVLGLVALAAGALRRSTPGRLIIAVRDNERVSAAFGVTPATVKLAVLALSGAVAGLAGVLWADAWRTVSVNQFPPDISLALLAAPVIGGLGSVAGAIAGAVLLYAPTYFVSPHLTGLFGSFGRQVGFQLALGGAGLVAVLLSYPTGVAGAAQQAWERVLAGVARRRPPPSDEVDLVVRDVSLRFGGVIALRDASIRVAPGEIVGLIGPNGAGKTTLLNVVSGVVRSDSGSVTVAGHELAHLPASYRTAFGVGRSFQDAGLFGGLTVLETVQVALAHRHHVGVVSALVRTPWARATERATRRQAMEIVEALGLLPWVDVRTASLSTGTRRICDLAAQIAARPRFLLLDEPTAGVAQRESEAFGPLLRRIRDDLGCAILLVEHDMPLLMGVCDRLYALEAGTVIAEGTPEAIRADPSVIASYLGTDDSAIDRSGPGRQLLATGRGT